MKETVFVRKVVQTDIRLDIENNKLVVSTTMIDGCKYAFYLYRNSTVYQRQKLNPTPRTSFSLSDVRIGDKLKVKVFYKLGHLKRSKFSGDITFKLCDHNHHQYKIILTNDPQNKINLSDYEVLFFNHVKIIDFENIGFKPRSDCRPIKLKVPIPWLADPFNDRNWMFQLHAWRNLDPHLNRFSAKDITEVGLIINDWTEFEKANCSKWLWYDMSTGLRALKLCYFLTKCYKNNIDHGIEDLNYILHKHLLHLSNPKELSKGNHGLFQLHGLKALLYIIDDFNANGITKEHLWSYANEQMRDLIMRQLGDEGVHTEDSPDYHFFAHNKITNITNAPWWSDLDKEISQLLDMGERAMPWLIYPDFRCVPVGDSAESVKRVKRSLFEWPHCRYKDIVGAKVGGYGVVRTIPTIPQDKSSYLFFQGSFHSNAHKHCDDLSFVIKDQGQRILIDSGKYGYQQDKYRAYFLGTSAHNTIVVDDTSTSRSVADAYGSAIIGRPVCFDGIWQIKGCVNHARNKYLHHRSLYYQPGFELYVVDTVVNYSDERQRKIANWWHFDTNATIGEIIGEEVVVSFEGPRKKIVGVATAWEKGSGDIKSFRGHDNDFLAGWTSKAYLNYEPTWCLRADTELEDRQVILTHFKFSYGASKPLIAFDDGKLISTSAWINDNIASDTLKINEFLTDRQNA